MNLTQEQKEQLGIVDERVDFYFKVENAVIDGYTVETVNSKTGKIEIKEKSYFDNIYELAVYTALSRYCNNGKVAFPSHETLAIHCCCGKTSVKNAIASLEKKGFIKKINRKKSGSNENDTNVYAIKNIEELQKKVGRVATEVGRVATEVGRVATSKKNYLRKNNIKRTTTTKEQKNSSSSDPNLIKYLEEKKVNKTTIKNILKLDVTLERVEEVMNYCSENKLGIGMVVNLLKDKSELKPIISTEGKKLTAKEKANYIKTILSDEKLEELMEEAKQVLITTGISLSENRTLLTEYESLLVQEYNKKIKKQG